MEVMKFENSGLADSCLQFSFIDESDLQASFIRPLYLILFSPR